tara:strand:- start:9691 stop:10092 length:402 start_codon:yes stop_codon:yes gene_type:complete
MNKKLEYLNKVSKVKKHNFMLRESDFDNATSEFMAYRLDLDVIVTNNLPDLQRDIHNIKDKRDNAYTGLKENLETLQDIAAEYERKADEIGFNVEDVPEYGLIGTKIFEVEEQIELSNSLNEEIVAINSAIRI